MLGTKLDIKTTDGTCDAYVSHPPGAGPWPAVIYYTDAFGLRDVTSQMCDRIAAAGYYVVAPNVFYRSGAFAPFDPATVFSGTDEQERGRMMKLLEGVTDALAMDDTRAILEHIDRDARVRGPKIGCVGYCMGGGLSMRAAVTFRDRVAAAASFHGARLLVEPEGPGLLATAKGTLYIGVAEIDRRHTAAVSEALEAALTKAAVPHQIELYAGASHGFAVNDLPVYDAAASEKHWERLLALFGMTLR